MNIEYKVVFMKKVNTQLIVVKIMRFKIAVPSIKIGEKTYIIDWSKSTYMKTEQTLFKKHNYFEYHINLDTTEQFTFNVVNVGIDPSVVDLFASQMVVKQIAKGIGGKKKTNWLALIGCIGFGALTSALVCVIIYTNKIAELLTLVPINPILPI